MSGIPPALLYLTIYNPTLRPDVSTAYDNDEDAEEQAQILFYTCRDRAVSRDKMLRQVGLAKALVNFAEIFHSTDPCQNVHSQSRRMVMVSPEPNFWIHVAVELAKTPRAPAVKPKIRDKGKGKAKEEEQSQAPQLDYHDGTLHDIAVRTHLLRGYEQFKLTHGSFSSIVSCLGQHALEVQLERFFTVWAWTWDLGEDVDFGMHLGLPLHPSYSSIHPTLDDFSSQIPNDVAAAVVTQRHVAPCSRYKRSQYPVALARYLMHHLVPTPALPPPRPDEDRDDRRTAPTDAPPSGGFLGVSMSMSMSMDVRKWGWPSFGKSPGPKELAATTANGNGNGNDGVVPHAPSERAEAEVDQSALEDAIASDNSFGVPMEKKSCAVDEREKRLVEVDADANTPRPSRMPSREALSNGALQGDDREKPQFTWTDIFLAPSHDSLATCRRRVYLLKRGEYALALLGNDPEGVEALVKPSLCLLDDVERIVGEGNQGPMAASLPSVTKILQPKDNYILKTGDYMNGSGEANLHPDYLFEAKGLVDRDPTVIEVFSRDLHPQHWHVVSRVTDGIEDDATVEAYLQVSRKEATLSDVDNILRGLYKTHV